MLVPFPYTDLSSVKTRPALVISKLNDGEDIILVAITSKIDKEGFEIKNNSLKQGLLPKVSLVKTNKVVSLKKTIIKKRVAILKNSVCAEIIKKFKLQF